MAAPRNAYARDALLLFAAVAAFFLIGLGARAYMNPSEARYIEIPRQMLSLDDWLTPRINGVPYFEKPPLFYWMQAATLRIFGTGEFAGRMVTALLAALTCVITYATARLLYGRIAGFLSATVLATCLLGYGLSRIATLDMPVSFFITACIASFLAARHTHHKRRFTLLMYAASALAVMTKGLIGAVIPGMVIGAWIIAAKQWRVFREMQLIPGLLLFFAITAPWHILMAREHPEFLQFYFIHEHVSRYLTEGHRRIAPWWFFIAVTLAGLMPWAGLLPAAIRRMRPNNPDTLLLALWISLPLVFFSLSSSKLVSYIFPIFPPLAIVLGRMLAELWEGGPQKTLRRAALLAAAAHGALLISLPLLPLADSRIAGKFGSLSELPVTSLLPALLALAWLAYAIFRNHSARRLILALAILGGVTGLTFNYAADKVDKNGVKPLAQLLAARLHEGDMVAAFAYYWQDLPVYLGRNVEVVEWRGELGFGVTHYPDTQSWMIPYAQFWERCRAARSAYVFAHEDAVKQLVSSQDCRLQPVAKYGKTELLEKIP